jgi:alpha,alpha-trehalase
MMTWARSRSGGRRYYLNRSQPPLLALMVDEVLRRTGNVTFVVWALPILITEYRFWMTHRTVSIALPSNPARIVTLNRFFADASTPRPEAYVPDLLTARGTHGAERARIFTEVAAGAESGWDFSSRWFSDRHNISRIATTNIIPVDLNAILCRVERTLAHLLARVNRTLGAAVYQKRAEARARAMMELMWSPKQRQWLDFDFVRRQSGSAGVSSNFFPLWGGCFFAPNEPVALPAAKGPHINVSSAVEAFELSGLLLPGGWRPCATRISSGTSPTPGRPCRTFSPRRLVR